MSRSNYEVICGNIGRVHEGSSMKEALKHFREYVSQSRSGYGRAGGEEVALFKDGEIVKEFFPADAPFPYPETEDAIPERISKTTINPGYGKGRLVYACPDSCWQSHQAAWAKSGHQGPEPFPFNHGIFRRRK